MADSVALHGFCGLVEVFIKHESSWASVAVGTKLRQAVPGRLCHYSGGAVFIWRIGRSEMAGRTGNESRGPLTQFLTIPRYISRQRASCMNKSGIDALPTKRTFPFDLPSRRIIQDGPLNAQPETV
jgi:hypothetical protein